MKLWTPAPLALSRRAVIAASGALVLAVLIGGSLYLTRGSSPGLSSGSSPGSSSAVAAGSTGQVVGSRTPAADGCGAASCASSPAAMALAAAPAVATMPSGRASARAHASSAAPSASAGSSMSGSTAPATPAPSMSATSSGSSTPDQGGSPADQVLALINQARASAGLPALTVTSGLETTSSAHNLLMADGCGLSHQCPGEPPIGTRETNAGIDWTAAGENIGEGGPVSDTTAAIASMAVGLTQSMLDEQPPNDGHRMNILSTSYTHIGIAVYRDSSGTVWLTQDFSN
jgi:uncharacterized protein YkwD